MNRVTGSIQNRNGIYHMVVRYTDFDGQIQQKTKSTKIPVGSKRKERQENKEQAIMMLGNWKKELIETKALQANRKLMQAIDEWMESKKKLRANTYSGYQSYIKNHLKPYFRTRNKYLYEYTVRDMQKYIDFEEREGRSAQSIKKYVVILNGVFNDAIRYGEIAVNPCDKVKYPSTTKFKGKAYTATQAQALINGIKNDPGKPGIMLALFLGLRRSEVAGLRWQDVDFQSNLVHIRNTVVRFSKLLEEEHTKSESSRRDLIMPTQLKEYLLELKAEQDHNRELCGDSYIDSGHVCQWPNGKAHSPDYIYSRYKRIQKELGLPDIRLHDLRHTAGSLLINSGKSAKQVQEFLGHEDVSTTLNIYTHTDTASLEDTAAAMDFILSNE